MEVYNYSLHLADAATASLCNGSMVLRRSLEPLPLAAALVRSAAIVKANADALQKILEYYQWGCKKATTKTYKITEIMKIPEILSKTSQEERKKVEELLAAIDARRNKKQSAKAATEGEQDDEAIRV